MSYLTLLLLVLRFDNGCRQLFDDPFELIDRMHAFVLFSSESKGERTSAFGFLLVFCSCELRCPPRRKQARDPAQDRVSANLRRKIAKSAESRREGIRYVRTFPVIAFGALFMAARF